VAAETLAEHGAFAAGLHRREEPAPHGQPRVADGVDAPVDAVQPPACTRAATASLAKPHARNSATDTTPQSRAANRATRASGVVPESVYARLDSHTPQA
jgi:hypothetical protein